MCTLGSFFSSRPNALRHIFKSQDCHTIQHIFVPTRSVWRKIEKIQFSRVSNSKFVNFPQIFPCSNYKICPIIPLLFPFSNGDSPVATTFPVATAGEWILLSNVHIVQWGSATSIYDGTITYDDCQDSEVFAEWIWEMLAQLKRN